MYLAGKHELQSLESREMMMRESSKLSPTNVASHAGVQFRGAQWGLSSNPVGDVICGLSLLIDLG